jgi:RNA chaperone Hfq
VNIRRDAQGSGGEFNPKKLKLGDITMKAVFNIYAAFLNEARKEGQVVTVIFLDGTTCSGVVSSFDDVGVLLLDPSLERPTMIFRHSIRQIL